MHDHIRDCAKIIAEEGSMPRRLNNIDDLLEQSPSVITEVRGIATVNCSSDLYQAFFDYFRQKENNCHVHIIRNLQLVATGGGYLEGILGRVRSPHLIWLRWIGCSEFSLPDWIPMENLKVLEVHGTKLNFLWPHQSQGPLQLRELNIWAPLSKFPSIGQLKYLESIYINAIEIQLETLPQEFCQLCSLKFLVLKGFSRLMSLPFSFGKLTNLQYIDLDRAFRLQMLPNSFGDLSRLKHLSLAECSSLTISNRTLGNITTLEYLYLNGCRNVKELPPQVAHQRSLEKLCLAITNLKELPSGIGDLCNLEVLQIGGKSLEVLHPSVGYLKSLKNFFVFGSPKLKCLPDSFELLTQLTDLTLERCGIEFLPEGLLKLNNLNRLTVYSCPLRELPFKTLLLKGGKAWNKLDSANDKRMFGLRELSLLDTNISEVAFPEGVCPNLQELNLKYCQELRQIRGLCGLSKLTYLFIESCVKVDLLSGLGQLTKLHMLQVKGCHELVGLPGVEHCMSLRYLTVSECPKLQWDGGVLQQLRRRLGENLKIDVKQYKRRKLCVKYTMQ